MNNVMNLNSNEQMTMSSLEIAELTGKRHDHVMRDIRNMLEGLDLGVPNFGGTYKSSQNKDIECFNLPKRETMILVSGYNVKLRAAIVDRWQELEKQQTHPQLPDFTNPAIAAEAWAKEYRAKEQALIEKKEAEEKVRIAAPKVNHYDTVVVKKNLINATQVGAKFKMSARKLNPILESFGVYNKGVTRSRVFRQWFIDNGYGEVRQTDDGYTQSLFTMLGEAWVVEKLVSEGII